MPLCTWIASVWPARQSIHSRCLCLNDTFEQMTDFVPIIWLIVESLVLIFEFKNWVHFFLKKNKHFLWMGKIKFLFIPHFHAHLLEAISIVCISSWFTEYCARRYLKKKKTLLSSRSLTLVSFQLVVSSVAKKGDKRSTRKFFFLRNLSTPLVCKFSVKSHRKSTSVRRYLIFRAHFRSLSMACANEWN